MVLELENAREEREGEMVKQDTSSCSNLQSMCIVSFSFTCNHIKRSKEGIQIPFSIVKQYIDKCRSVCITFKMT